MNLKKLTIILIASRFTATINAQFIQVDDNRSGTNLVNNVLINSPCASWTNVSVTGGNLGANDNSFGYFNANMSGFPFSEGVILSTGKVKSAIGPNNSISSDEGINWSAPDIDLEKALNILRSINATVLEFDFIPLTNKFSFEYIFSSEQYLLNPNSTIQCGFTDGFAFLLREDGSTVYKNIALIPGTTTSVSVKTVRGSGTICSAANEQFFGGFNGTNHPTNFNGQTIPLKAAASLIPGKKYHIKIVIADQGNHQYDSAIFLKAGSFNVGVDLGIDRIVFNKNALCIGDIKTLDATQPGLNSYKWFKNGIDMGISTPTLNITDNTNSNEVIYSVEVTLGSTTCFAKGEVKIQFVNKPILNNATLIQCDDDSDGKTKFNLTQLDNTIRGNSGNIPQLTALNVVKYFEDSNATIPITNPEVYTNTTTNNQTIFAQVANDSGCSNTTSIALNVLNNNLQQTIDLCDVDVLQDGKTIVKTSTKITPNLVPAIQTGLSVKYYKSKSDAISQDSEIVDDFVAENQQIIYARISNGFNCSGIIAITLKIFSFDSEVFKDEIKIICPTKTTQLEVPSGFSYSWSNGNLTDNFINISSFGIYSVLITNSLNCSITKKFDVQNSDAAIINAIEINDFDNNNTILVNYSGNGDYEFSLNGVDYQDSPLFTNVKIGQYFVYVRDKNGCRETISNEISVLDFPKFFTPNNDGINDFWKIDNLDKKSNITITIFDRHGKLCSQFNASSKGWDGNLNEKQLPADDYWFTINIDNNRLIKNHFALKR